MSARSRRGAGGGTGFVVPKRVTLNGQVVDRRTFLGALALTAAGTALPIALAGAGGAGRQASSSIAGPSATDAGAWHVDDMWGHWPRYAHPIPYTLVQHVPVSLGSVDPADRMFVM